MVQTGCVRSVADRSYEDYVSLHKHLRKIHGDKVRECYRQLGLTSTAALVEVENKAGVTITDIGKTEITLMCGITNGDDALYTDETLTIHYFTSAGVAKTAVCTMTATMHTTSVAFVPAVADFYCWDTQNYTPSTCCVSSYTIIAGDTLIVHTVAAEGTIWATISAGAVVPTDAQLISVGSCYGDEAADTTHAGPIATMTYWTPWGQLRSATMTYPVASNTATRFADSTTGYFVGDFYRRNTLVLDTVAADEFYITNLAKNAWYDGISVANFESVHTRITAYGSAYGKSYVGDILITIPSIGDVFTLTVVYTPKGRSYPETVSWDVFATALIPFAFELEPLSDVTFKYKKTADANHVAANFIVRHIEVPV